MSGLFFGVVMGIDELTVSGLSDANPSQVYVVTITAGPYKGQKPAFQATRYVRASSAKSAELSARRLVPNKGSRPRFHARLATPADLGMKPATPSDSSYMAAVPQPATTAGMWCVKCKCGHAADIDLFSKTPSGEDLARNEYQCPKCYRAWRVEQVGDGFTTESGFFVPPSHRCTAIIPRP
ncbi:hypothetical protein PS623_04592 [Pseudomonas fluorescens]|nr:hypothetical protein PS623_04592 [Pseudomonas fluorescens]